VREPIKFGNRCSR